MHGLRVVNQRVVAVTAAQGIGAASAVQNIVSAIPDQRIGERVAAGVDRPAAGKDEVLEIGAERVADTAQHRIRPCIGGLGDEVASGIDDIGVVARATRQGIVAGATIEDIVRAVAEQDIVAGIP